MKLGIVFGFIFLNASWVSAQATSSPFTETLDFKSSGWSLEAKNPTTQESPQGWLIDFQDDVSADTIHEVLSTLNLEQKKGLRNTAGRRISVPSLSQKWVRWLLNRKDIESVEPNQVLSLFQEAPPHPPKGKIENPDDPLYKSQWHFEMINLPKAWKKADGEDIIVAVIDTGLDWHHLDINPDNIWRNPGEDPDNGVDDDNNGYVDDVIGWDFLAQNNRPWDFDGHGTVVAGIIAAAHNDQGIAGINPHVKIMVLNNSWLGMVKQWQKLFYNERYSATDLGGGVPDFVGLAEAMDRIQDAQATQDLGEVASR